MGLDQELRAVYPDGYVCYIREWRKNHLLRTCIRTYVPNYVDNGTTTIVNGNTFGQCRPLWNRGHMIDKHVSAIAPTSRHSLIIVCF